VLGDQSRQHLAMATDATLDHREIIYARTETDRRRWRGVETKLIVKQLDQTEARIARRVNTGRIDIKEELRRGQEDEDED
jgi:hypothetical protein